MSAAPAPEGGPTTGGIAAAVERHADELARRPILEMYAADPFWSRRFGRRGERHAGEDGRHHVVYLVEALREGDALRFVRYAEWLRTVLVARGMCTRHVLENLARLGDAANDLLARDGVDAAEPRRYLREAAAALAYATGPAAVAAGVAGRLADRPPYTVEGDDDRRELTDLAWYLADALAARRDDLFVAHVRWLDADRRARGDAAGARALLATLRDALAADAPDAPDAPDGAAPAVALLDTGARALAADDRRR